MLMLLPAACGLGLGKWCWCLQGLGCIYRLEKETGQERFSEGRIDAPDYIGCIMNEAKQI